MRVVLLSVTVAMLGPWVNGQDRERSIGGSRAAQRLAVAWNDLTNVFF